jgi:hypothetical protein
MISTKPGLKFNSMLWFVYFCMSIYLKNIKTRTFIDPDKISGKMLQVHERAVGMFA